MIAGFVGAGVILHRRPTMLSLALTAGLTASAGGELILLWAFRTPQPPAHLVGQWMAGTYLYAPYAVFAIGGWVAFVVVLVGAVADRLALVRTARAYRLSLPLLAAAGTDFAAYVGLITLCNPTSMMTDQGTRDLFAGAWRNASAWAAVVSAAAVFIWMRTTPQMRPVSTIDRTSRAATTAAIVLSGSLSAPALVFGLLSVVDAAGVDVIRYGGLIWFLAGVMAPFITPTALITAVSVVQRISRRAGKTVCVGGRSVCDGSDICGLFYVLTDR